MDVIVKRSKFWKNRQSTYKFKEFHKNFKETLYNKWENVCNENIDKKCKIIIKHAHIAYLSKLSKTPS